MWFVHVTVASAAPLQGCAIEDLREALDDTAPLFADVVTKCTPGVLSTDEVDPCARATWKFLTAYVRVERTASCLRSPLSESDAARLHGVQAMQLFVTRDRANDAQRLQEREAFAAELSASWRLNPNYRLVDGPSSEALLGPAELRTGCELQDKPLWEWVCLARAEWTDNGSGEALALPRPGVGDLVVDGRLLDVYSPITDRPARVSSFVQVVNDQGQVMSNQHVTPGDLLPVLPRPRRTNVPRLAAGLVTTGVGVGLLVGTVPLATATNALGRAPATYDEDAATAHDWNVGLFAAGVVATVGGSILTVSSTF